VPQEPAAPRPGPTVESAVARIRAWGEAEDWRAYDPYDGLNSPLAPVLTLRTALGRRLLTQAVKRSPANLRPPLGIRRDWNAKGVALVASAYAHLWAAAGDEAARAEAVRRLEWLAANHADVRHGCAWGYHFDVQTRFFFYGRRSPNTIATSFVARAFLDAAALLDDERWAQPAHAAATFLADEMLVPRPGGPYFRYIPGDTTVVHNANLLACATLARAAAAVGGDARLERAATAALETTLRAQRADGSWAYAEEGAEWIDNFHTGYVLESLAACADLHDEAPDRLDAGMDFWARALFLPDGRSSRGSRSRTRGPRRSSAPSAPRRCSSRTCCRRPATSTSRRDGRCRSGRRTCAGRRRRRSSRWRSCSRTARGSARHRSSGARRRTRPRPRAPRRARRGPRRAPRA
jgi:hypothetical protein